MMNPYKYLIISCVFLIFILSIGSISANENITDDVISTQDDDVAVSSVEDGVLSASEQPVIGDASTASKTITIEADPINPNQVLKPTVQPAIDAANPGDTIILKGNFVHCHFTIN